MFNGESESHVPLINGQNRLIHYATLWGSHSIKNIDRGASAEEPEQNYKVRKI